MKKALVSLFAFASIALNAQISANVPVYNVSVQDMVRSTLTGEWVYIDRTPRHAEESLWMFDVSKDDRGSIMLVRKKDNERFVFLITSIQQKDPEKGIMTFFECEEISTGDKCTIVVHDIQNQYIISVMMPGKNIAIFYDDVQTTFRQQ